MNCSPAHGTDAAEWLAIHYPNHRLTVAGNPMGVHAGLFLASGFYDAAGDPEPTSKVIFDDGTADDTWNQDPGVLAALGLESDGTATEVTAFVSAITIRIGLENELLSPHQLATFLNGLRLRVVSRAGEHFDIPAAPFVSMSYAMHALTKADANAGSAYGYGIKGGVFVPPGAGFRLDAENGRQKLYLVGTPPDSDDGDCNVYYQVIGRGVVIENDKLPNSAQQPASVATLSTATEQHANAQSLYVDSRIARLFAQNP